MSPTAGPMRKRDLRSCALTSVDLVLAGTQYLRAPVQYLYNVVKTENVKFGESWVILCRLFCFFDMQQLYYFRITKILKIPFTVFLAQK